MGQKEREQVAVSKIRTDKCLKRQELQRNKKKKRSKETAKTTCSVERGLGGL